MLLIFSLSSFVLCGCIQEIDVFSDSDSETLVIDGIVTNVPEKTKVRLSFATEYNVSSDFSKFSGAEIKIIDDLGNETNLNYTSFGFFRPDGFVGTIGRSYHLSLKLKNGDQYYSTAEEMQPVATIDDLSFEREGNRLYFLVDFKDDPSVRNYYRWRYRGVYKVNSPLAPADQQWCWVTAYDRETLVIEDDFVINGENITSMRVQSIELDQKLQHGYSIRVDQQSLSEQAYEYWLAIKEQIENGGTIFETPNYQITGNVYSENNPEQLVLGYFGASAINSRRIFISDFVEYFPPLDCTPDPFSGKVLSRCLSCFNYGASSTNIKPDFWP